jgi:hypothetical protein
MKKSANLLLAILLMFFSSMGLKAQIYSFPNPGTYGLKFNRGLFAKTLHVPTIGSTPSNAGALNSNVSNLSAIVYDSTGHKLYVWDPSLKLWKSPTGEPLIALGTVDQYWRGDKTWQTLDKTAVGLSNVDNTADADKPVSSATLTALALRESVSNKSTDIATDAASNVKYPTVKAVKTYVDAVATTGGGTGTSVTIGTANGLSLTGQSLSLSLASSAASGALSAADWSTFNGKQSQLSGTGFIKASGSTIMYDNTAYYPSYNPNGYISGINSSMIISALGYTPYNPSNISFGMVTSALGYTPYNASNPNGYISGINSSMVTSALGYTPYNAANSAGYITATSLSGYVPYSGATADLNLGSRSVTAGAFYEYSDVRLKRVLWRYCSSDISTITFKWKDKRDLKTHWGYSAQQVKRVLPHAVSRDSLGYLVVDYSQVHTYKIKELEARVAKLEYKLKRVLKQLNR